MFAKAAHRMPGFTGWASTRNGSWAIILVALTVTMAIFTVDLVTWPIVDAPVGSVAAPGFVVTIDSSGDAPVIKYGFDLPNGTRKFDQATVGVPGGADSAYGWDKVSASDIITVAYLPSDPDTNVPYLEFPVWGSASWASLIGLIVFGVLWWGRARLRRAALQEAQGEE